MAAPVSGRGEGDARPTIPPVAEGPRPRWSVMIPTFNCDQYLDDALRGVVRQLGDTDAQIEVVDDRSTVGDPEEVVRRVAGGRASFFAQPVNVGHTRNFNTCVRRSRGELVHLLHGDDLVYDGFYERMGALADAAPEAGALICRHAAVHEDGTSFGHGTLLRDTPGPIEGWLARIASGQLLQPPAVVVRRSLYERIGGYDERLSRYGEDWEMWVRIAAATTVWYEPSVLAAYRTRPDSLSSTTHLAANMRDMRLVMATNRKTMRGHVPAAEARRADRTARVELGNALVRRARRALNAGSTANPGRSAIEAARCSRDLRVSTRAAALMVRWLAAVVRGRS